MGLPTSSNEPGHRLPSASNTRYTGGSCLRRLRIIPLPKKRMVTGQGTKSLSPKGPLCGLARCPRDSLLLT